MTTSPSPMNISMSGFDNFCDEKCAYSFKYQISNICTATNYGSYIYLNYIDAGTVPPVSFNSNSYKVDSIEIYSPSLHYFNGNPVDGEVIITHSPLSTGQPLIVCIPLSTNSVKATAATQIITDIINSAVTNQLKQGDPSMTIKLNDYNLDTIVPVTPFFYYTGSNNYNIIVYGLASAISVNQSVITGLQKIITPEQTVKYPAVDYYYMNKYGPSTGGNGDGQIYIDCQPTGNSEETEPVTYSKPPTTNDLSSSQTLTFIIGTLIVIFLIIVIYQGFLLFTGPNPTSMKGGFKKMGVRK